MIISDESSLFTILGIYVNKTVPSLFPLKLITKKPLDEMVYIRHGWSPTQILSTGLSNPSFSCCACWWQTTHSCTFPQRIVLVQRELAHPEVPGRLLATYPQPTSN